MCKLNQRRSEKLVDITTNFILISFAGVFSLLFYFSETNHDRIVVGVSFTIILIVFYGLHRMDIWGRKVEINRGNYSDEKETVAKMV